MPDSTRRARLFFALWPDAPTRAEFNRSGAWLHQHWGGRRMRADTLHLTLAFLGDLPPVWRERLLADIAPISLGGFELEFATPGYWRHNRIGWLGPRPSAALDELAGRLRSQLVALGAPFDAKPFNAHVTLLRNCAGGDPPPCRPVVWKVDDFALIESRPDESGAHYTVLKRWALG